MRWKRCWADVFGVVEDCVRFFVFRTRYLSLNGREPKIKLVYRKVRKPVSAAPGEQKGVAALEAAMRDWREPRLSGQSHREKFENRDPQNASRRPFGSPVFSSFFRRSRT